MMNNKRLVSLTLEECCLLGALLDDAISVATKAAHEACMAGDEEEDAIHCGYALQCESLRSKLLR